MARKKKVKTSWLKILLLFLFVPAAVWFGAFLLWFYWYDINNIWSKPETGKRAQPSAARQREQQDGREGVAAKRAPERILDEDRKKLDEILRRRN